MILEYDHGSIVFFASLVSLTGNIAPLFAVGRGTQVRHGSDFVLGGGNAVAMFGDAVRRRGTLQLEETERRGGGVREHEDASGNRVMRVRQAIRSCEALAKRTGSSLHTRDGKTRTGVGGA